LYVADNFPGREQFVAWAFAIRQNRGWPSEQVAFYKQTVMLNPAQPPPAQTQAKPEKNSTEAEKIPEDSLSLAQESSIKGVLIYQGMAIQLFGGNAQYVRPMAEVINLYRQKLPPSVRVLSLTVPTHAEFYLPKSYRHLASSESENIRDFHALLLPGIVAIDPCATLRQHQKEYIYFNTDHHWTGLGAYYAYQVYCQKTGQRAVPLRAMQRKVIPGFYGSLYWLTRDARLRQNVDSVVYHVVPGEYRTYALLAWNSPAGIPAQLYVSYAKGPSSYGVYLGIDDLLLRVDNPRQKNRRKILLIKNSYGNPLATYLVPHFEQVFIVDYRYFKGKVLDLVHDQQITDVMLFNTTFSANTITDVQQIRAILGE
ncbi:MAG: hypothetical protein HC913_23590, partial [Microscillaceae bacterium]|nr:hypothetical protein [Microscillaceae bacterium]